MIFKLKYYLKFLYQSKNEHSVHSPFVFNLVTKCFYDKSKYESYKVLKSYRNKRTNINDATTAQLSLKYAKLLFRIVHYFQPNNILELEPLLGLPTIAIALGSKNTIITRLVGSLSTVTQAKIEPFTSANGNVIHTAFANYLKSEKVQLARYNLIYFGGNHSKQKLLHYFEQLLPTALNNSIWIFNNIHQSTETHKAWKIIKKHPKVTVTVTTFGFGLVFFRSEQQKEHFVIRI